MRPGYVIRLGSWRLLSRGRRGSATLDCRAAMPDARDLNHDINAALEAAEQAAGADDYEASERLLREAVALQEVALGHVHPDLANTLNNLGVVYERTGNLRGAEQCYRRAYGIATRALVPGHPFIRTAEDNLRQFCATCGIPFSPGPAPGEPVRAGEKSSPVLASAVANPPTPEPARRRAPAAASSGPATGSAALPSAPEDRGRAPGLPAIASSSGALLVAGIAGLVALLMWTFGGRSADVPDTGPDTRPVTTPATTPDPTRGSGDARASAPPAPAPPQRAPNAPLPTHAGDRASRGGTNPAAPRGARAPSASRTSRHAASIGRRNRRDGGACVALPRPTDARQP
jgi:hypothetical protein